MKRLTGNLQEKNGNYYAVINRKVDGKRKPKWIPLNLPIKGNKRQAEARLRELLDAYEKEELNPRNSEGEILLLDYLHKWLASCKSSLAVATFNSYQNMLKGRITRWLTRKPVTLAGLTPQMIQDFYQEILDEGYTANTVIHYHAVLHKALKTAVKKDLIPSNPTDKVDKPKKKTIYRSLLQQRGGDPSPPAGGGRSTGDSHHHCRLLWTPAQRDPWYSLERGRLCK